MRAMTLISGLALGGVVVVALAKAAPAAAQSFDCRDSGMASERAVCGSDRLSGLDERMTGLYASLMAALNTDRQRESLRGYQLRFLAVRNRCGRDTGCIKGAYLDQIEVLSARLRVAETDRD